MKLATRIWATSALFVITGFAVLLLTAFLLLGPPPEFEQWPPGPLTVTDSAGNVHHVGANRPPHAPPTGVPVALLSTLLTALLLASLLAARSVVKPLESLQDVARRLGGGDLEARTGVVTSDEVGDVARAFDDMADRVESLVRAQRELLANVSHELRTPLARVRVALELAVSGTPDPEIVNGIENDILEVERLIDDLLTASRLDPALHRHQHFAPSLCLEELLSTDIGTIVADRFRRSWPEHPLTCEFNDVVFTGDQRLVVRLLDNLLDNAGKYSAAGSGVELAAGSAGDHVVFVVSDHGVGVASHDAAMLGTPFFRVDRSRARGTLENAGGVGLGLVLARRIAEAHGGSIAFDSTPGIGTRVTVRLPFCTDPSTAAIKGLT